MDDANDPRADDLLDSSLWRPLRRLQERLDADIAALYVEAGLEGIRTRFTGPLIHLFREEPRSIRQLATAMEVTHSAMSQTVAAMRRAGLVESVESSADEDGRTRRIRLTEHGRQVAPFFAAEWRATEASLIELEREIPYPLTQVVRDIEAALSRRSFRERLRDHLRPEAR